MAVRADNLQELSLRLAAPRRDQDFQFAAEIAAGERIRILQHLVTRSGENQLAPVFAGAGAQVHHVIGRHDGVGIMFDHQQRVAEIAQTFQDFDQAVRIAGMQAYGGFVQHIQSADELDALGLSAGERGGQAIERKIIEADFV